MPELVVSRTVTDAELERLLTPRTDLLVEAEVGQGRFEVASGPGMPQFSPGGPRAWLATLVRTALAGQEGAR